MVDLKDHLIGRLQYQREYLARDIKGVDVAKDPVEYLKMALENAGIFYDVVVKQRGYVPEPNDVVYDMGKIN